MANGDIRRAFRIARVLSSRLVFHRLNRHRRKSLGVRMREACEELGTSFIKIGQLLSLRYDLLPPKDCDELHKLLDSVPPFDYALARDVFIHDFGVAPEQAFARFEPEPFASASVSQVHRAWLNDGRKVAVKIRRPYIGAPIERDTRIFRSLVRVAQFFSPALRKLRFHEAIEEVNQALLREIDLRNEAQHLRAFARQLKERPYAREGIGRIRVPEVHESLSSYNVLTTEFLDGVPFRKWREEDNARGYDALKSVNTVFSVHVAWLFEGKDFTYHGDLHPANFIVMKDGDMGLVDFGIIGQISARMSGLVSDTFFAVYMRDEEGACRGFLALAGRSGDRALKDKVRDDVKAFVERAQRESVAYWFFGVFEMLVKYRLPFPYELTLMGRGQIMLDGVIHMIAPERKTVEFIGPEFEQAIRRRMMSNIKGIDIMPLLYVLTDRARASPAVVARLINRYADDPSRMLHEVRRAFAEED